MPPESLKSLVSALLRQLPQESSPVVIVVKPDRPSTAPTGTNGHRSDPHGPAYDPSVVFILELATIIAMRDEDSISAVGEAVADALHNVVRDATNVHPLIVSRAVFYLLHLLNASQVSNTISVYVPPNYGPLRNTHLSARPLFCTPSQASIGLL